MEKFYIYQHCSAKAIVMPVSIRNLFTAIGAITAVVAAVFALRKLYRLARPIRLHPGCSLNCDGSARDEILATIINTSGEPQYLVKCVARGAYSFRHIALTHIRRPFIPPMLYHNVWFGGVYYPLMKEDTLKIDPFEPVKLRCEMTPHPLNAMFTPYFLIEAKLSSGRIFRSKKLRTPRRWRFTGCFPQGGNLKT